MADQAKPLPAKPGPHESLAAALAAFQAERPNVPRDKVNPAFKSHYASLDALEGEVLPVLGRHGLSWTVRPMLIEGGFVLRYALTHESGQSIEGDYPLSVGKPQEMGSQITYGRRYALSSVTGVSADEDDDGNAVESAPQVPQRGRASARQQPDATAGAPQRRVTRDWGAEARRCTTVEQLRALDAEAEQLGERGLKVHPEDEQSSTVGQLIRFLADQLKQPVPAQESASQPEQGEPVAEWPAREPGTGITPAEPDEAF